MVREIVLIVFIILLIMIGVRTSWRDDSYAKMTPMKRERAGVEQFEPMHVNIHSTTTVRVPARNVDMEEPTRARTKKHVSFAQKKEVAHYSKNTGEIVGTRSYVL